MSTESEKKELLEQFQSYLEQNNHGPIATNEQPDMYTLLSELTGLKTEVKAESRLYKNTLDTLSSALSTVQEDNKTLSAELALSSERLQHHQIEIIRTIMLEIVDIYDRMNSSLEVLQAYQPVKSLFKKTRQKDIHFIEQIKQGQLMTIRRFEQLLQCYQVQAIDCIGKLLDPNLMNAVETDHDPKFKSGTVLEELRKGFVFQGNVLRLAEVKVNKIP